MTIQTNILIGHSPLPQNPSNREALRRIIVQNGVLLRRNTKGCTIRNVKGGGRTFWKGMLFFSQPAGVQDFFFNLQTLARFFFSKMTMPSFGLVLLDCLLLYESWKRGNRSSSPIPIQKSLHVTMKPFVCITPTKCPSLK